MKVILYMAMSLNGQIARPNNKEDFISDTSWKSFVNLVNKYGTLVIGRKTYEVVKKDKEYNFKQFKKISKVIVSKSKIKVRDYLIASSPKDAIKKLKTQGFKNILVVGGPTLNSSFAKSNLIDEIILNIEPTIVGKGISLFKQENFDLNLKLIKIKKFKDILQLHYKVIK